MRPFAKLSTEDRIKELCSYQKVQIEDTKVHKVFPLCFFESSDLRGIKKNVTCINSIILLSDLAIEC